LIESYDNDNVLVGTLRDAHLQVTIEKQLSRLQREVNSAREIAVQETSRKFIKIFFLFNNAVMNQL